MMSQKLVLIDGHSILNRAFYGVPDLSNAEGLHTNAIYGFLNIMFKILEEEKPDYLAVAFDVHAPTFRHQMYQAYKGTRKPMPEELRQQAESLCRRLEEIGVTAEVVSTENPVGGGAVPTQTLPSFAVAVAPRDSAAALEAQLRQRPVPIIVRIAHDRCLLDMRTLFPADLDEIFQAFRETAS